jgi:5'-nucleotidase
VKPPRIRRRYLALSAAVVISTGVGVPALADTLAGDPVTAQILSISDFHAQLEPPEADAGGEIVGPNGEKIPAGGAAYLATHVKQLQAEAENSWLISSGDHSAGAPFPSDYHQDEPNIEVMNALGLDFSSVGNHELDVSKEFLLDHLADGGCFGEVGKDSCFPDSTGKQFHGADFEFSAANLADRETGELLLDPYVIKELPGPDGQKIPVGFINTTVFEAEFEPASYQTDVTTTDSVATANKYAAELKNKGVNAIVLNAHEGAKPVGGHEAYYNGCDMESGPLLDIAAQVSPDIDAIVGGHVHQRFNCTIPDPAGNPRVVAEPGRYGDVINEIDLAVDPDSGEVIREETTSENHAVTRDVTPDPQMQQIVDYWTDMGDDRGDDQAGTITEDITLAKDESGESAQGNLAADINKWLADRTEEGRADLGMAMTDPHQGTAQLTEDMLFKKSDMPGDADGVVTVREAWSHGYGGGNNILTVTLTGEQLETVLEQQWTAEKFAPFAMSGNASYSFDPDGPIGDKVDPADVLIDGEALDLAKEYRVATISYTAIGRDGIAAFADFTDPYRNHPADHEALLEYLATQGPLSAPAQDRVNLKG